MLERETTILYSGGSLTDNDGLFDDLVDLYDSYGLTIEVASDAPYEDEDEDD